MKQYEFMSKQEIISFLHQCPDRNCDACPAIEIGGDPATCALKFLYADVPTKPRFLFAKCEEDLVELYHWFMEHSPRRDEESAYSFFKFLAEKVPSPHGTGKVD